MEAVVCREGVASKNCNSRIRGVAGTKKVWGGQTIRYFHLSCKLKYAETLL